MECTELDVVIYDYERWLVIKMYYKSSGEPTFIDCVDGRGNIKHIDIDQIQENIGHFNLDAGLIQ